MRNILIIADGILAKRFLEKISVKNSIKHNYFVVYYKESTIPKKIKSVNYYNFDPTSLSKLSVLLKKYDFTIVMINMSNKNDTISTYENIRETKSEQYIVMMDRWDLAIDDNSLGLVNSQDILIKRFYQMLPDVPIIAQNIGQGAGEIMEIRVPFGSSYLYRHIHSIERADWRVAGIYRNNRLLLPNYSLNIEPNDVLILIGKPKALINIAMGIKKEFGQFPQPFGKDIYFFLDAYKLCEKDIELMINDILMFHSNLNSQKMIIKLINPSYSKKIQKLKYHNKEHINLDIEYIQNDTQKIIKQDLEGSNIGMIMVDDRVLIENREFFYTLKVAILKIGSFGFHTLEDAIILNSDSILSEQISSVVFDISNQLGLNIHIKNYQLDEDKKDRDMIYEHFNSLSDIFENSVNISDAKLNPLRELKYKNNFLHCIPFSKKILKWNPLSIFSNDVDRVYFKLNNNYQLFIPIEEISSID